MSEILGYDPKQEDLEGGILGVVKAYYGCVEAQGRGWFNPNQIKEKALANGGDLKFQEKLLAFLDDTISTSIPPDPDPDFELELGKIHPCATRGPTESDNTRNVSAAREKDLHNLVKKCQFHTHHPTCYKYWRGKPEPKECRFDLDESNTAPISVFDPETGELPLRCLDGLAIRCNMDIKFIGSGLAAKAILYYITDYITKTQLQAHVAYAALELAKCAHSMIAKQELSAQHVVSYLMDYEDHFTSHKFSSLYWTGFEKFINDEDPSPECYRSRVEIPQELPEVSSPEDVNAEHDVNSDLDHPVDIALLSTRLKPPKKKKKKEVLTKSP
ncbi:hypothetical protein B0H17DRAFT_1163871 [Mycena rosella]|uniref:Uncharacterized protein n=1 Tax=Mycena rosella TaxID=1033263 RepID=A0AAD7CCP8_MYCRO|nr:hypothetical protein B0H17DRAFT_1163871 [Mycena rosella]